MDSNRAPDFPEWAAQMADLLPSNGWPETSLTLLEKLKTGDQEAQRRWFGLYGPEVNAWLCRRRVAEADREDILVDVFTTVIQQVNGFEPSGPNTFRGWLIALTRYRWLDHIKANPPGKGGNAHQEQLEEYPDERSMAEPLDVRNEPLTRTVLLLNQLLDAVDVQILLRVVVQGEQPVHVANDLSMKPGLLRTRKCRALRFLRDHLQPGDLAPFLDHML